MTYSITKFPSYKHGQKFACKKITKGLYKFLLNTLNTVVVPVHFLSLCFTDVGHFIKFLS